MHPHHVAAFVRSEVDVLLERARSSTLPITNISLENKTDLFVTLTLTLQPSMSTRDAAGELPIGAGLVMDGFTFENVPDLSRRRLNVSRIVYSDLTDFDTQPPTAELLLPDRTPLPGELWPHDPKGQGIVDGHPDWRRKWFCRPGSREYHTHPEHEDRPWDEIRGDGAPLHGLILGLVSDLNDRFIL